MATSNLAVKQVPFNYNYQQQLLWFEFLASPGFYTALAGPCDMHQTCLHSSLSYWCLFRFCWTVCDHGGNPHLALKQTTTKITTKKLHVSVAVTTQNDLAVDSNPLSSTKDLHDISFFFLSYQGKHNSILMHGYDIIDIMLKWWLRSDAGRICAFVRRGGFRGRGVNSAHCISRSSCTSTK